MKNSVANVLRIIGIIEFVTGIILGLIFTERYQKMITWWIAGFVSGMLFIAIAEIIELLHEINLKLGSLTTDNENKK
nr:hypothetical protein [uncultured Bacillus sp.]